MKDLHETFFNEKGMLAVIFRYDNNRLNSFTNGYQVQFETISNNEFRGNHYHYPKFAGEEFYLLRGYAALIACDLDISQIEMYLLKKHTTYYVPALIAHQIQNIGYLLNKKMDVELIISKHYNYQLENLQKPFIIPPDMIDKQLINLIENYGKL